MQIIKIHKKLTFKSEKTNLQSVECSHVEQYGTISRTKTKMFSLTGTFDWRKTFQTQSKS